LIATACRDQSRWNRPGGSATPPGGSPLSTTGEGSVTRWLGELRSGDDAPAQRLWERYFDRLVHLARRKLRATAAGGGAEDEEDAALSAFDSFCRGAAQGRYPRLADRQDLWRLLVVITVRKAIDQVQRRGAAKRGAARVVHEADLAGGDGESAGAGLDRFVGPGPSPELAALVAEEYRRLRSRLEDDSLRLVLDLSLEGYRRAEIAERMGRTVKTVARKLDVIRAVWLEGEGRA
jgi:DNA-directed RNA polymerase specialized sigma24 family protein